ncbi:MAG: hydroxymethylglutaryl-CoA lyase [Candidatus Rokuibacteriota bacterium]|nr:MAG: hydroxymethylglutaryl-CoA lyase [Candidatus Rokubacteria bacterium]
MTDPVRAVVCECFARDGLQNQDAFVPTELKIRFIDAATEAGFPKIEVASYAHPKYLPQFRDTEEVLRRIRRRDGVQYLGLVPNDRGLDRCLEHCQKGFGPDAVGTILSASEPHNQANVKRTVAESKAEIESICRRAGAAGLRVIGGIATAFGCPIQGEVPVEAVLGLARWYAGLGVQAILFGDTTGLANPVQVEALFERVHDTVPEVDPIAHFHDTRGTALANSVAALRAGVTHFDASTGGVGGRPKFTEGNYPAIMGFTGNACTEDLVAMLEAMGVETGIDLGRLVELGQLAEEILGRELQSHVVRTGLGRRRAS